MLTFAFVHCLLWLSIRTLSHYFELRCISNYPSIYFIETNYADSPAHSLLTCFTQAQITPNYLLTRLTCGPIGVCFFFNCVAKDMHRSPLLEIVFHGCESLVGQRTSAANLPTAIKVIGSIYTWVFPHRYPKIGFSPARLPGQSYSAWLYSPQHV